MCTLVWYLGFMGSLFMLSCMFKHDYLDTYCFECLHAFVLYICICTCSAQLSMFHMERCSGNMLIIIIIIHFLVCRNSVDNRNFAQIYKLTIVSIFETFSMVLAMLVNYGHL